MLKYYDIDEDGKMTLEKSLLKQFEAHRRDVIKKCADAVIKLKTNTPQPLDEYERGYSEAIDDALVALSTEIKPVNNRP